MTVAPDSTTVSDGGITLEQLVPGAQLRGADLTGLDLTGVDLSKADLAQADLSGVRAMTANFAGAVLHGANLDGAQFLHADFSDADLSDVSADGANFGGSTLDKASLFGAELHNASLSQASLVEADLRTTKLIDARLREAVLTGADATNAEFQNADLSDAVVGDAVFQRVDLNGAKVTGIVGFRDADWIGCDTTSTDFTGAFLARRTIIDQNYLHEFRNQSPTHEWLYKIWWLTSDCGRSLVRWGLCTLVFALVFAGIYEVVDIDYGDDKTLIHSFYFSIVTLTTLGYGDVLPQSQTAQAVVVIQVIIGYGMLGGLLSLFANMMSRRGE